MPNKLVSLLLGLVFVLAGLVTVNFSQAATTVAPPPKATPKPAAKPEPPLPYEEVEILTPDNRILMGRLYDPSQKPESEEDVEEETSEDEDTETPTVKYPLVILLHGLNGSGTDWGKFPNKLVKAGYAVFAPDMRGHGKSSRVKGRGIVTWRVYKAADWKLLPKDVNTMINYFRTGEDYPQVNAKHVVAIGAKLGANTALLAAIQNLELDKDRFKALVMISPSLNYKGLETTRPIVQYKNPSFIIASQTDAVSFEEAQLLYRWALGGKVLKLYKNIGDGTDILKRQPDLQANIPQWIGRYLPGNPKGL